MTDGWWRIKQHAPNAAAGFTVTEIAVTNTTGDEDGWLVEPHWYTLDWGIKFFYADRSEEYFPWASIVHAEYQPPTKDTQ